MTGTDRTDRARRRYIFVGTGHRAEMYFAALLKEHRDVGVPVGLCDTNRTRMAYYQRLDAEAGGAAGALPAYHPDDFEKLLEERSPDAVVVTTVDSTHARYITAALDRGCDVICEKPLTTDAEGCRRIAEAAARSTGELIVTFNYRYAPRNSMVKKLLMEGAIGHVTSVAFEWVLDTVHGADYFRRWHREKRNSGGLLVHKATHHFDLVGWWLDDLPETVFALGLLRFYGPDGPIGRARREGGAAGPGDPFALDVRTDPRLSALYGGAREEDGYIRDRDVFSPGIDIEDNMAVLVQYETGTSLTYSLNAHAPWEGYRVAFNGTEGRLELNVCERAAVVPSSTGEVLGRPGKAVIDPSAVPERPGGEETAEETAEETGEETGEGAGEGAGRKRPARCPGTELILQRHWTEARHIEMPDAGGAHGGGDARLLDDVFRGAAPDPLGRRAGHQDGIRSVLVGVAANRSIAERRAVRIAELGVAWAAYGHMDAPDQDDRNR